MVVNTCMRKPLVQRSQLDISEHRALRRIGGLDRGAIAACIENKEGSVSVLETMIVAFVLVAVVRCGIVNGKGVGSVGEWRDIVSFSSVVILELVVVVGMEDGELFVDLSETGAVVVTAIESAVGVLVVANVHRNVGIDKVA